MLPQLATLPPIRPHRLAIAVAACGALLLTTGCGTDEGDTAAEQVAADAGPGSTEPSATATTSPSASGTASASPTGTYTITEGFGVEASGTSVPYHVVTDDDWWVEDPESKFYNSMHSAQGADFPLIESGDRGSEHLIDYPTQYAKALVINLNRWPAAPGRGAGIFLHVNGSGATAGCVSVPRATMDRFMNWIEPSAHPRIAIG
ncbi:L,D-transpeptidase family protein [Streptomyces sp. NPDC006617]|uniref:L,D-transpeptidase family protein n=1 Tax=Streptomyces sp. NPDC006617 TaxID=3155354 RepID=UPI0033A4B853